MVGQLLSFIASNLMSFDRWRQRGCHPYVDFYRQVSDCSREKGIINSRPLLVSRPENVPAFIEAVKRREKVLSGFGHRWVFSTPSRQSTLIKCIPRVYKTVRSFAHCPRDYVPNIIIVRSTFIHRPQDCRWGVQSVRLLDSVRWRICLIHHRTGKDELLETAMALHKAAMKDDYFIKRKLAPNVDFWYVLQAFFWCVSKLTPDTGGTCPRASVRLLSIFAYPLMM